MEGEAAIDASRTRACLTPSPCSRISRHTLTGLELAGNGTNLNHPRSRRWSSRYWRKLPDEFQDWLPNPSRMIRLPPKIVPAPVFPEKVLKETVAFGRVAVVASWPEICRLVSPTPL